MFIPKQFRFPLMIALAVLTRSFGILSRPIWYDEAFAILFSAKGPAAMLYGTLAPTAGGSADIHPLGYYTLLWLRMKTFGTSLVAVLVRNGILLLLTVAVSFGLYQHVTYRGFSYAPYKELNASLRERFAPGDVILHSSKATRIPSAYYDPDFSHEYLADPRGSDIVTLAAATQQAIGLIALPYVETATKGARRVWFNIFQRHTEAYTQNSFANHPHLEWLEQEFTLDHVEVWGDVRLYIFIER